MSGIKSDFITVIPLVAVLMTSCGGGTTGGSNIPNPGAQNEIEREWERFRKLSDEEQTAELNTVERRALTSVSAWSGLVEQVGGAESFDATLKTLASTNVSTTELKRTQTTTAVQQLQPAAQNATTQNKSRTPLSKQVALTHLADHHSIASASSEMGPAQYGFLPLAVSLFEVGLVSKLLIDGTNGNGASGTVQSTDNSGANKSDIEVTVSTDKVSYQSKSEGHQSGLAITLQNKLELGVCPDATGQVSAKFTSVSSVSKEGTQSGSNTRVEISLIRLVDDNAKLTAQLDYSIHVEQSAFDANTGTFVDADWNGKSGGTESGKINRTSTAATQTDIDNARNLGTSGLLIALQASEGIQSALESGRCVRLEPTTLSDIREKVAPSTAFQIFAVPRSKIDGAATGGTVKASLAGGSSINPENQPVLADATFNYVAPSDYDKQATVTLEARSKRGAAKALVAFSTKKKEEIIQKYNGSASVAWTFDSGEIWTLETINITLTFDLDNSNSAFPATGNGHYIVQGTSEVTRTIPGCTTGSAQLPITGTLDVFANDGTSNYSGGYTFGFVNSKIEIVNVLCGNTSTPIAVGPVPAGASAILLDEFWIPYTNIADLSGSKTAKMKVISASATGEHVWSFIKVN